MAARVPSNRLLLLDGGHACFVENPEKFNREVANFAQGEFCVSAGVQDARL
eukprot:SAG31_NODE_42611_length_270_cov_2.111111_1_plen_51_part_00